MKLLLDDGYAPITSGIGFVKFPAKRVVEGFVGNKGTVPDSDGRTLKITEFSGNLQDKLQKLLPLNAVDVRRSLFIQTNSEWTAYMNNNHLGTDARMLMMVLADELACDCINVVCIENTLTGAYTKKNGRYGAMMFELYRPQGMRDYNTVRSISAMNDGGKWSFDTFGEALPFEEVESYQAKRVKDRFTPEMLDRYLKSLGIHAFDEAFYDSPGEAYLVETEGPTYPNFQSYSLEEVRARFANQQ